MIGVLVKTCDNTETLETPRRSHVATEAETGAIQLQAREHTSDCWPPTEAEREAADPFPEIPGVTKSANSFGGTSQLRNSERIISVVHQMSG